jgi:hypothetical protein
MCGVGKLTDKTCASTSKPARLRHQWLIIDPTSLTPRLFLGKVHCALSGQFEIERLGCLPAPMLENVKAQSPAIRVVLRLSRTLSAET